MRRGCRHSEGSRSLDKDMDLGIRHSVTAHCLPLDRSWHLSLVKDILLDQKNKKPKPKNHPENPQNT